MEYLLSIITSYILIPQTHAASPQFLALMGRINQHFLNPLIVLLFTGALLLFMWGMFNFFTKKDDTTALETGKRHILWGIVGMAIMVSVFGIINFLTSTLGIGNVSPQNSGDVSNLLN